MASTHLMKRGCLLLLLLCPGWLLAQEDSVTVMIQELEYGIIEARIVETEHKEDSPSLTHHTLSRDAEIYITTDSIPLMIGQQFAVFYQIQSPRYREMVQISWHFPEGMLNIDGQRTEAIHYATLAPTRVPSYASYILEGQNELLEGWWTFELRYGGQVMIKRPFYLYWPAQ